MLFGHNSNVKAGDTTYHVQTEDRGTTNALIDTTVYFHGRVLLQVAVRNRTNQAVQGAKVTARVNGAAEISEYSTETGPFGHAQLEFAMPRLAGAEPALVIEASHGNARGHLRFQLRTKPRVPSAR